MALFAAPGLRSLLRDFRRSEDGSLIVFSLFLLAVMVLLCGMAVDLMRVENRRVALSQALDQCTLNAASMRQTLDAETVVRDCVERQGLLPSLTEVTATSTTASRTVQAKGVVNQDTLFMHALGVNRLPASAQARAEQRASSIEIVLALDVSFSMNSNQRINNLRTAATNFVDTVLARGEGRISISIVPYNAQVNLSPEMSARYNITQRSGLGNTTNGDMRNLNCVDFADSAFDQTGISTTAPLLAAGWVDGNIDYATPMANYSVIGLAPMVSSSACRPIAENFIVLPTNDATRLKNAINALLPSGQTSINIGMKWAGAMLDPLARPVVQHFSTQGTVPPAFSDRPFDYSAPGVTKIIVLMTDGENVGHFHLNNPFRNGLSPIFRGTDGVLSIRFETGRPASAGSNQFWIPNRDGDPAAWGLEGGWAATSWGGANASGTQLTWPEVWQVAKPDWVAWHLYARPFSTIHSERVPRWSAAYNGFVTGTGTNTASTQKDGQLQRTCNALKAKGVIVYGVAFSASAIGTQMIQACASSAGHAFVSTNGTALNAAFQAIATNVTQLRLTQ